MSEITLLLIVLFASIALLTGTAASLVLGRVAPGRRRLFALGGESKSDLFVHDPLLADAPTEQQKRLAAYIPKSPKDMTRLQRRLAMAGYHGFSAALTFSAAEIGLALLGFLIAFFILGLRTG